MFMPLTKDSFHMHPALHMAGAVHTGGPPWSTVPYHLFTYSHNHLPICRV